jgi:hypothetical protein
MSIASLKKGRDILSERETEARARRVRAVVLTAFWAILVTGGFLAVARYESAPGEAASAPAAWPAGTRLAPPRGWTMVVFTHPQCPCTPATLHEIDRLRARLGDRFDLRVVLAGGDGPVRAAAARIPGVALVDDPGGAEAARFGATTSGHVFLFDGDGRLRFHGGVTPARGHEGDSAGADAVVSLVLGGEGAATAPVFGCPLFDAEDGA